MAATSLAIWDTPQIVIGCNSPSSRWGRQFTRSMQQGNCRGHRRFLKLQHNCSSSEACSSGFLHFHSFSSDHLEALWSHGRKRIQCLPRKGGNRSQVFCVVTEKIVGETQLSANADRSVRRLILLRHAKSSWADRSIKDHERPLSKRGRQAAANIALKLQQHPGWEPQLILCSDSTRTRETLDIMQQQMAEYLEGEVRYFSSFYSVAAMDGQTVQHLQDIICKYSKDDVSTIMCMGHNRGWEEAASLLSGVNVELKTANAALLETPASSWQEAFERAGMGGWKLIGIVKPDTCNVEGVVK